MDSAFPGQHTTTTTVTTSTTTQQRNIRMDISYVRTIPGMLKVAQAIIDLIGFICIAVTNVSNASRGNWFNTVAMFGFWFTGILLALYIFHVVEKFYRIPWIKIELVFCAVITLCYLLAASLAAAYASYDGGWGAGAFFGFCAMALYGYDAWLKYRAYKTGAPAQGEHVIAKQTSTVTSPAY